MSNPIVIIIADSPDYRAHCEKIAAELSKFGVPGEIRIASAYRTPARLLAILEEYESGPNSHVYITVAGYGDAVSGLADSHVSVPVIACPPLDATTGAVATYPAIKMPVGVAPLLALGPENAALAAIKVLVLAVPELAKRVERYQQANAYRLVSADVKKQ